MAKKNLDTKKICIFVICCIVFLLISIFVFFQVKTIKLRVKHNKENEELQEKLSTYIEKTTNEDNGEQEYNVKFKELKEINPDTIAYLKINNININSVVVKGNDNSYYLSHKFENNDNTAGWIFADYKNKFNFTDYNIVIYGQDTKTDSMFGGLKKVLKEQWYNNDENKYITLVTDENARKYQIFSIYQEKPSDYPTQVDFNGDDEYLEFLNTIKSKSIKDFNIEVNSKHGILTLMTCGSDNSNRIIIHAISSF